jgi:dCMP deaminase
MDRNKWDIRYLELAQHVASWSKDPSSKVGAVVVKNNRVVAVGFNGFPAAVADKSELLENRDFKYEMVVHAEMNALLVAGQRAEGATLYVLGRPVCATCAGAIIQSGIERVVAEIPSDGDGKWDKSGRIARAMLGEAGKHFDPHPHGCLVQSLARDNTIVELPASSGKQLLKTPRQRNGGRNRKVASR